jgi:molecular chaperone GrpE
MPLIIPHGKDISEFAQIMCILMMQESIEENKKKADIFESQYNKLKQEFKEYIETSRKNEEKRRQEMKADFSKRLLVVADSLNRTAGLNSEAPCEMVKNYSDNIRKNIEAVYNQMLSASGLAPIQPVKGDKFDEQKHLAVGLEYGTAYPNNTIFRVIRKGYFLESNVVRPAEVIVMKNSTVQKVIKKRLWERFMDWINPARLVLAEINQKLDILERMHKEKIEKIAMDIESLINTVHELDAKAKQADEFGRMQKERIEKIAMDIESLRNIVHELDAEAKQIDEFGRIQKERIEKIPWI